MSAPGLPVVLAFLDVGFTEFLLIAALFLLLFGADKVPELARALGKASAQFRGAAAEFGRQIDAEKGLIGPPGDAVPRDQMAATMQHEREALERLRRAARELGIDPAGKGEEELRAAIAARVSGGAGRGGAS